MLLTQLLVCLLLYCIVLLLWNIINCFLSFVFGIFAFITIGKIKIDRKRNRREGGGIGKDPQVWIWTLDSRSAMVLYVHKAISIQHRLLLNTILYIFICIKYTNLNKLFTKLFFNLYILKQKIIVCINIICILLNNTNTIIISIIISVISSNTYKMLLTLLLVCFITIILYNFSLIQYYYMYIIIKS